MQQRTSVDQEKRAEIHIVQKGVRRMLLLFSFMGPRVAWTASIRFVRNHIYLEVSTLTDRNQSTAVLDYPLYGDTAFN